MIPNHKRQPGAILLIAFCLVILAGSLAWSDEVAKKETKSETECVTNAAGPLTNAPAAQQAAYAVAPLSSPKATVGKPAPDFEATAYYKDGFTKVKLSDYAGKWVVLCFYPGDFTFV
jgi:hypothetical protein